MAQRWTLTLGQTLRCTRTARGLTMDFIAEQSGRHQSSLSIIERDKTTPSATFLRNIAPFYGCPWWTDLHNVSWLSAFTARAVPKGENSDSKGPYSYLDLGVRTMHIVQDALAEDLTITPLYQRCVELFGLPGFVESKSGTSGNSAPVWAWVVETLALNEDDLLRPGPRVVERARSLLTQAVDHFEAHAIEMRMPHAGHSLRVWRETRHWSSDTLAEKASEQLDLMGEPPLLGQDIERIEAATVEVDMERWMAIARALEVPLSHIMPTMTALPADDLEETILQLLHQHGLGPRAIDVVKDLIQLMKAYADDARTSQ